ncbi:MAG: hypothetical protein HY748_04765 [Elusimicrobia bacterium]|nr:hypothetical protein [Elusimicrobiota bacterium]
MSQTPDIKPELNKGQQPEQEEKKRSGFFANLFSKATGGGSATGGLGSAAAGGILATKAGIVGLAIIGTTVAGGIGYVGYKAMMPSSEPQTLSIFEARPKSALPADESGRQASKDGVSGSLDMFAKANAPDEVRPPEAASQVEPAAEGSASPAGSAVDHGDATLHGPAASIPKPQFSGKIGGLSGSTGGSGTSASFSAGSGSGPQFTAGKKGGISAMGKGSGARPTSVGGAMKSLRRGSNMRTLGQIKKDQLGGRARSSAAAGRTYDGNTQAGSFGTEGGVPEGGAGAGAQDAGELSGQPSTAVNDKNEEDAPPPPKPKDVTPWAKQLNMAKMLLMGAAAILFIATQLKMKETAGVFTVAPLVRILAAVGGLMALAAMVIGFTVLSGKFGQKALGTIFALSGGLLTAVSVGLLGPGDPETIAKGTVLDQMPVWMQICGVVGLVGVISTQFLKPKTINCAECKEDKSCKKDCAMILHLPGGAPSDRAMDRFVV